MNKVEKERDSKGDNLKYWKMTVNELLSYYKTNEQGYSDATAKELQKKYGPNELEEEEKESIWEKIFEQFQDTLVRILLVAAVISFILALTGDHNEGIAAYIEPFVILLILIANAAIGVFQDINAGKAIDALKKMQASVCNVKRNGNVQTIDSVDLIPGDIVVLSEGEKVPADIRIIDIHTSNFECVEAALTGESEPTHKTSDPIYNDERPGLTELRNMCFSSTGVALGQANGIVVKTGMATEIGVIMKKIGESKEEEKKSPLKQKLEEFGDYLTYIILAICIIVWVINYKNFFDEIHGSFINGMIYYFKISVALAVAAIPEGLPAVITTCLALGSKRLSANNAIVRKLDSIETLGCTSVICSDKTGTLTTNNMSVTRFMVVDKDPSSGLIMKNVTGTSFKPEGSINEFDSDYYNNSKNIRLAAVAGSLCNLANIQHNTEANSYVIAGSPTEGALKVFVEKLRIYDNEYKHKNEKDPQDYNKFVTRNYKVLYTLEFDRNRKAMSVLALDNTTKKPVLFTKGASEIMINQCSNYYGRDGNLQTFNESARSKVLEQINEHFTTKSLRSLSLCVNQDLKMLEGIDVNDRNTLKLFFKDKSKVKEVEQGLTFLGVVGIIDPPRSEVKDSINTCKIAGIRVIMITGDNKNTAEAIAKDIGIVDNNEVKTASYSTAAFFKLNEAEQLKILRETQNMVFSRSEPNHKRLLVKQLQQLGHIVAMTGDGVNDAAALATANIGVAMGITGTEVAKEASHIVLADDNFATIVKAVEEGRSIYMNMKAFIRYLISSNIGEVVSIFLTSIFGIPEAFTSIQLLWVNLVTDGPPATALGFNPPERNIMQKPPRSNDDPLLSKFVIFRYFVIGTYVGIATIGIFVYWYLYFNHSDGHTLITWDQLTHWGQCEKWETFKVANYSDIDLTNPCDYFTYGKRKPVTLALTVLVIIEMFNAMNAISDESSLVQMPPWRNKWLILAIFCSVAVHCIILYIPIFNDIFGIMPLDAKEWMLVLVFSFPVILVDEVIKFFVRTFYGKNREEGNFLTDRKLKAE